MMLWEATGETDGILCCYIIKLQSAGCLKALDGENTNTEFFMINLSVGVRSRIVI